MAEKGWLHPGGVVLYAGLALAILVAVLAGKREALRSRFESCAAPSCFAAGPALSWTQCPPVWKPMSARRQLQLPDPPCLARCALMVQDSLLMRT
jgi:hypothetical protein